jgi:hypothetical protein
MVAFTASTVTEWIGSDVPSSTAVKTDHSDVIVPDSAGAERLLERLICRSTSDEGLDRETLRNLNRDAWGAAD